MKCCDLYLSIKQDVNFRKFNASMQTLPKICIIDSDKGCVSLLKRALEIEGYRTIDTDACDAPTVINKEAPDLILLDLLLEEADGFEVLRGIKRDHNTKEIPIVIITNRDKEIDRVLSFELGADDYLIKPFNTRELILRIRSILRSTRDLADSVQQGLDSIVRMGNLLIDTITNTIWLGEKGLRLSWREEALLMEFARNPGRVLSRKELFQKIWNRSEKEGVRIVDSYVMSLRRKLGNNCKVIKTVHGVGYRFSNGD